MKKIFLWTGGLVAILAVGYAAGPDLPDATLHPTLPAVTQDLPRLEAEIARAEAAIPDLKADNEARIIWADSTKKEKTPYSLVYIHGFGASWAEGDPVHKELSKRYGANLYLARLHGAGSSDPDAFNDLTPENFVAGARHALAVGKALGDSVIVIGTSAGGLLTVYLAANHPELKGVVLYSPCMAVYNKALALTTRPWGRQIMHNVLGERRENSYEPDRAAYWLTSYHTNGLLTLQQVIEAVARPEVYAQVKVPTLLAYYYKNDDEQDKVVSVAAMREMFPLLGTPDHLKVEKALPTTSNHVIASHFTSKDLDAVRQVTQQFFEEVLHLKPVVKP
ncbi:carboxylesterase [Telluribacter sp. SYSU D00476]|uniref:alpha/beta hydrolase n=1 Tax=Telluribacter sp. SYSU D00476 TaxID=2811430 RepID=UPI001FF429E5|nr:alpha/beta hydrolase [Telluribacter sp. SYSU D00476]